LYLEKEEEKELLNKSRIEYEKKTKEAKNGNKLLVYCENTNASNLNSLWFNNILFSPSHSKIYAFDTAKTNNDQVFSLIDRDFLTDWEKEWIENNTNVRVLNYYCFENYLYHPENLKEYYDNKKKSFSISEYYNNIFEKFWENKLKIISNISSGRYSHKPITNYIEKGLYNIKDFDILLNEDIKFEELYKYFSMKDNCKDLKERSNISRSNLVKTNWFKNKIKFHLKSMWIEIE